jgi:hypothetical protein
MKTVRQFIVFVLALLFLISTGGISYLHHICLSHNAEHFFFVAKHGCCTTTTSCCHHQASCCDSANDESHQIVAGPECCTDIHHFLKNEHPFRISDNETSQVLINFLFATVNLPAVEASSSLHFKADELFGIRCGPDLLLRLCVFRI